MQGHGPSHDVAIAGSWDSDNVFYVGMKYSNMDACSQKAPASFHSGSFIGGYYQKKTAVAVDMTPAGAVVSASQPSSCLGFKNAAFTVGGTSPAVVCESHLRAGIQRVGHDDRIFGKTRCLTRPHYGFTKGRAVYCATHKKGGMVHLLKESVLLERARTAREREESRRKVAERKKRHATAAAGMANIAEDDNNVEWTAVSEFGRRSRRELSKRKSRSDPRCSRRRAPADSDSNDHSASAFPLYSQLPEGEGVSSVMDPSVEIKLLQKARESARAAAELLEASGALEHEGGQWMTREIKEADAKVKKETRKQRKHFKAVGLKAGDVIEAFTATQAGGDSSTADTKIYEGKLGSRGSGSGLPSKQIWVAQAPVQPQKQRRRWRTRERTTTSSKIGAKEAVGAFSLATAVKVPLKRAWVVSVPYGSARKGGSTKSDATAPTPKRSKEGRDGHNREDGMGAVSGASGHVSAEKQKITKWATTGEG
eukprot:g17403.t1